MSDDEVLAALRRHWDASDANNSAPSTRSTGLMRFSSIRNRVSG